MDQSFIKEFTTKSIQFINDNTARVISCLDELSEADTWKRPNEHSNSIGNLVLHLCGNMTQYVISSIGNARDERNRDSEFSATGGYTKPQLAEKLRITVEKVKEIIAGISGEELLRTRQVQGFSYSGIGIILHVTEHYSYHTGQIAFWTKFLRNKDLGFYSGIDLNAKNEING